VARAVLFSEDKALAARLTADLAALGFEAELFSDVDAGVRAIEAGDIDIAIFAGAPRTYAEFIAGLGGASRTLELPILIVISPQAIEELAVDSPVDDLIFTTYDTNELAARLKLLISRHPRPAESEKIVIGGLTIDARGFEVSVDGRTVPLTFREYELLRFLAGDRGRVFTRKTLVEKIWEYDYLSGTRTVDVHIRRLRGKLGARYGAMIDTVRNVGYRFSRYDPPESHGEM